MLIFNSIYCNPFRYSFAVIFDVNMDETQILTLFYVVVRRKLNYPEYWAGSYVSVEKKGI